MALDMFGDDDKIQIGFALLSEIIIILVTPTQGFAKPYWAVGVMIVLYVLMKKVLVHLYTTGRYRTPNKELADKEAGKHVNYSLKIALIISLVLGWLLGKFVVDGTATIMNFLESNAFPALMVGFVTAVVADAKEAVIGREFERKKE